MSVSVDRANGVLRVVLDRADKLNAMTDAMWQVVVDTVESLEPADRVVVLTGAGDNFCAGSDVSGFLSGEEPLSARIERSNRALRAIHALPIPTVAVVRGIAAGAGANLALCCDFVLAADDARFCQIFIRRGLSLDSGASWLLPRLVGDRRARELALLGGSLDAPTALDWGMISRAVSAADLDSLTDDLVDRLAGLPAEAVAGTKELLDRAWDATFAEALDAENDNQCAVIAAPPAQAAIASFLGQK